MLAKWRVYRRLPWVRVVEARDCGASVFASIARYYKHYVTLEEARNLVGTDRDGTTLSGLRDGGRAIGLESRPAHGIYDAIPHIQLPAIAHLNGREGHFVAIHRWSPDAVDVLDPGNGLKRLSRADFEAQWSGYLVEYKPTPALKPRAPYIRPFAIFCQGALAHKGLLLVAILFGLLATSLGWTTSFFLRTLLDRILPNREGGLLMAMGVGLLAVSGVQALLQLSRLWVSARIGRIISIDYGSRFIAHLIRLPMRVFDSRCIPGLVMRINQTESFQQSISESVVGLLSDSTMFLAALAIIMAYDPVAALIALVAVPLMLAVIVLLNDRVYNAQLASMVRMDEFSGHMIDTFDGLRTIKTFSAEDRYRDLVADKFKNLAAARYDIRVAMALPTAWSLFSTALVTAAILWYSSAQVMAGHMTAGELIVLFGMLSFYLIPVQRFPTIVLGIRGALIGVDRLEEILALDTEQARTVDAQALSAVRGRIEFQAVTFGYKARKPVLKEISLAIEPGETVAIVGETGSGKTSLANLIAGFYLPQSGDVRIDGISTRHLNPEELRRSISAVFQGGRLFQHSVHENITLLGEASLEDVRAAARQANAEPFINDLLNGFDSQVARGGDNFSSGQVQRLELARALLKDAPILILDEATSNLDGATEQGVLQALESNRRGRTTVFIAHRLSTVVRADRIIVMDAGRIVEMGTHRELLARKGRYYGLFHGQVLIDTPVELDTLAFVR